MFPAHILAHRLCAFRGILTDDDFLGDPSGLAYHRLFCRLMNLDGPFLEGPRWHACFAGCHWPPAFHGHRFVAKRDTFFNRLADDVAADARRPAIDGALANLQLLLGKRDDLLVLVLLVLAAVYGEVLAVRAAG